MIQRSYSRFVTDTRRLPALSVRSFPAGQWWTLRIVRIKPRIAKLLP
jgi:hypothetical protein